eukprot:3420977-Prymnesium_polylepis.1
MRHFLGASPRTTACSDPHPSAPQRRWRPCGAHAQTAQSTQLVRQHDTSRRGRGRRPHTHSPHSHTSRHTLEPRAI